MIAITPFMFGWAKDPVRKFIVAKYFIEKSREVGNSNSGGFGIICAVLIVLGACSYPGYLMLKKKKSAAA